MRTALEKALLNGTTKSLGQAYATGILRKNDQTQNLTYRDVYNMINGSYDPEIMSEAFRIGNPHLVRRFTTMGSVIPKMVKIGWMDHSVFIDDWWPDKDEMIIQGPLGDLKNSGLPLENLTFKYEGWICICGSYYSRGTRYSWLYQPTLMMAWFDQEGMFNVKGEAEPDRRGPPLGIDFRGTFQEWKDLDFYDLGGEISKNLEEYAKTL